MKKNLLFTCFVLLLGALASCGGGGSSDKSNEEGETRNLIIKPKTKTVTGPLGKAFEVIERDYKLKKNYGMYVINVELTLANPSSLPSGFDSNRVGTHYDEGKAQYPMLANFIIEYLDEDGDIIETSQPIDPGYKDLMRLSEGESSSILFNLHNDDINQIKYFRIKSDYYPNEIAEEVKKSDITDLPSIDDEELYQTIEQVGKAAETAGKMVETAGEIIKELNNLTN